jgi:hypothetical protein
MISTISDLNDITIEKFLFRFLLPVVFLFDLFDIKSSKQTKQSIVFETLKW